MFCRLFRPDCTPPSTLPVVLNTFLIEERSFNVDVTDPVTTCPRLPEVNNTPAWLTSTLAVFPVSDSIVRLMVELDADAIDDKFRVD